MTVGTLSIEKTNECIDEVLGKYSNMIYRLAFSHMRTKHDAEDIFQDVFLSLISKPRAFNDEEHLKAWLIRVTINRCKSVKSSAWYRRTAPLEESAVFETVQENDLFEYLSLLPVKYRTVIHLFYYEDLPVKQIAEILKAKESTVRTWLTRARAVLREKMKGDYFNE